jgi:phospholipid/cholesterol/gamma-HCH transport system substrate-binding protein
MLVTSARPLLTGAFVLGAMAILVITIVTFGRLHLFRHTLQVVVVFPDSIAGLEEGAPVTFRGLRIGTVEDMRLHVDVRHQRSWIPVHLAIDLDRISWANGPGGTRAELQAAVRSGLRAQLVPQSLVSGQMAVNLDYHPGTSERLDGPPEREFEIPAIPSDLHDLEEQLLELDLPALSRRAQQTLLALQGVSDRINAKIGPLAAGVQATLASTRAAVRQLQQDAAQTTADIGQLTNESRSQIATNGRDLDRLLRAANRTVNQTDSLIASLSAMTSPRGNLQASLRDLAASASSLRSLTHDLNRSPLRTMLRKQP